jgi:L-2-hydroxyglutarate oxidase LhgO
VSLQDRPDSRGRPSQARLTGRVGIVGAGIVGLALARELLRRNPHLRVTVLEKEDGIGLHQTSRNSGVVHAGIYYPVGSLKTRLCTYGVKLLRQYCEDHQLPYDECGKVIVATEADEMRRLEALHARGCANGVPGLRTLDGAQLRRIEPEAAGIAALHSPQTAITDFAAVARAIAREVRSRDGGIVLGARVHGFAHRDGEVTARSTAGDFTFDRLIICAGLYTDKLAQLSGDEADPRIVPFRGDYWQLRPERRDLVRGLIYPVPDERFPFLGIHLTKRIDGEVLIGPNAVLAFAREGYRFGVVRPRELATTLRWPGFWSLVRQHWRQGFREMRRSMSRRQFVAEARRYVPALQVGDVVKGKAGVRAQAVDELGGLVDDFRFSHRGRVINVRNAPSPAATSALAIAEHIAIVVEEAAGSG